MKKWRGYGLVMVLAFICLGCVEQQPSVVGGGSPVADACKAMVTEMRTQYDFKDMPIQVKDHGFWEKGSLIHLRFSSVLSETVSTQISRQGGRVSLQEIGEEPLRIVGTYLVARRDVLITLRLRQMGLSAGKDLAVVSRRIPRAGTDDQWFVPEFTGVARSLVRMLESGYSGVDEMGVKVAPFEPARLSQPPLVLGDEMEKYMKDALAGAVRFSDQGTGPAKVLLKGDYVKSGEFMVFHAALVRKENQKQVAGASLKIPVSAVPREMLQPGIQSLDGMCRKMVMALAAHGASWMDTPGGIAIPDHAFHDSDQKAVTPLCNRLVDHFREEMGRNLNRPVTQALPQGGGLVLSGRYCREKSGLVLFVDVERYSPGQGRIAVASVKGHLGKGFCDPEWFRADLKSHCDYLMAQMDMDAAAHLTQGGRHPLMIQKFTHGKLKAFSDLSEYLNSYFLDYFDTSPSFVPVVRPEIRITRSLSRGGKRNILPVESTEAAISMAAGSDHYISGSFWRRGNNALEIKARLMDTQNRVLASGQVIAPISATEVALLAPQQSPAAPPTLSQKALDVELFTQRGRNNLEFKKGETITFFARASKDVFVQIFNQDALGHIYRIYPNAFDRGERGLNAGQVTAIPNDGYARGFKFQVGGTLGREMVFAFASDRPLPDLPTSKHLGHGIQQVNLDIHEVKDWYSNYCRKRGISLSWDSLPILTR